LVSWLFTNLGRWRKLGSVMLPDFRERAGGPDGPQSGRVLQPSRTKPRGLEKENDGEK